MGKNTKSYVFLCIILLLVGIPPLHAYWQEDGVPICTATGDQDDSQIIPDGTGGAIITWHDTRSGNYDIYARRIDEFGSVQWTADGEAISTAINNQTYPQLVSDGAGGAIICWDENRSGNYDIYAQRIDAAGTVQWTADGVAICTATAGQYFPELITDGAGGAIITWQDTRSGDYDIYAQRIDAAGSVQWTADGVAICTATADQSRPLITSDNSGGAIITWHDNRSGNPDIYAQRIDSAGSVQWIADGRAICTATGYQEYPRLTSDGIGGAIITWTDTRSGNYDIYAQRVNVNGIVQWTVDGEAICAASGSQYEPQICSDNSEGAIITWYDYRSASDNDIYAQRIISSGTTAWGTDGKAIIAETNDQWYPQIIPDDLGGAIITWYDYRSGNDYDVYAQKVDDNGNIQWAASGVAISTETGNQRDPQVASDGAGGAIVTLIDQRSGNKDIYAQRVERSGYWGYPSPYIYAVRDVPGDQGGYVNLSWDASRLDPWPEQFITYYSIWKAINPVAAPYMLNGGATILTKASDLDPEITGAVVRIELLGAESYYWELVATQDANYYETYSKRLATDFDSTAVCTEYHYFQVCAHTSDPKVCWTSPPDSGYSVDNLAPYVPQGFMLAYNTGSGNDLEWDEHLDKDFQYFCIYRDLNPGFTPDPGNLVHSTTATGWLDTVEDGWMYYYKITALDIHGNESDAASPATVTDAEVPEIPRSDYLSQNFPNPFNPNTTIKFGLKERSEVSLNIYDASGRLVRLLVEEVREAATYEEGWDGKDNNGRMAASGVYFYRLTTRGFRETRKMILLK